MRTETAQILISRLNPKSQGLDIRVDGLKGGITGNDIAAAMSGCPPIQEWTARLCYAGQKEYKPLIREWLLAKTIKRWDNLTFEQKEAIVDIVLNMVTPDKVCPTCKGRKEAPNTEHKLTICQTCEGDGWVYLKNNKKYKMLNTNRDGYFRYFLPKIKEIKDIFERQQDYILETITSQLSAG